VKRVCVACGAEYGDDAEFCNACGGEVFQELREPEDDAPEPPVRADTQALWMSAGLWLVGLGYFLTVRRPRDLADLALDWLFLTTVTFVLGLVLRNMKATLLFSLVAIPFLALYWLVKLS